jgi:predicted GH43/DUF377 family glycosyl hydrolase
MKRIFVFLLAVLPLFLNSCSKESVTEPAKETKQTFGSASFRIDKVNAPSNVSTVTAYLSRQDCDTLTRELNIADSSASAEMLFENIKTGLWHLKVLAQGSAREVLYSGETDIFVEDSKTTEVSLTLTPKPTGMGSVYISIKWGSSGWTDYDTNPIFTKSQSFGDPYGGVSAGKVLFENGIYKMWYINTYESGHGDVQYAESIDGIHWHNVMNQTILQRGPEGSWDSYMVGVTAILKDDNGYKMYYAGCSSYNSVRNVGLAFSTDGLHWQKSDKPVFTALPEETSISATAVVKKGSMYYMYYSTNLMKIGVAVSQDGISWERNGTPALETSQSWEASGIVYPAVIVDGEKFVMIYKNWDRTAFGMAESFDGIHWTKSPNNPVFEAANTSRHWTNSINYPWLLHVNNQFRIYYTGIANGVFNLAVLTKSSL